MGSGEAVRHFFSYEKGKIGNMRCTLFTFTVAFSIGLWILLLMPERAEFFILHSPTAIWFVVLSVLLSRYLQKPLFGCVIAGLCTGLLYTAGYQHIFVRPIYRLVGQTMQITATVCSDPEVNENGQRVEVSIPKEVLKGGYPKAEFSATCYLPISEDILRVGDRIEAMVSFYKPTKQQGFDRQRYQMAQGNWISFSILQDQKSKAPVHFVVTPVQKVPWYGLPQEWNRALGARILQQLPEREGGFLYSLLLGNRSHLDFLDAQNLKKAGLSHIIAVSGMHLMFLIGLVQLMFSRRIGVILSIGVIALFLPMAGGSPSILRAGIMATLSSVAFLLGRENDGKTSLAAAGFVLLCSNPYSIFHLSFQLSFLSTLGILCYARRLEQQIFGKIYARVSNRFFQKPLRVIGASIGCSLCAILFTAPVVIWNFGYMTLLSIPANLITLGIISLTFSLGVFFCLIPFLAPCLTPVLQLLIDFILNCAKVVSRWHWGVLYWEDASGKLAIAMVILMILLLLVKWKSLITVPLCFCVLVGAATFAHLQHCNTTRVTLHAVGDGQMLSIAKGYDTLSLIDCGGTGNRNGLRLTQELMNEYGFSEIDTMVLTAVDRSHAQNAAAILEAVPVKRLIVPSQRKKDEMLEQIQDTAQEQQVPVTVWKETGVAPITLDGILSAEIAGGVDRKLGVHLADTGLDLWVLHSMTQTMLVKLLRKTPLTASDVILANGFEKQELLEETLEILHPDNIILSSAYASAPALLGVPVQSTAEAGDLVWRIPHTRR